MKWLAVACLVAAAPAVADDVADIRAARAQYNAAILAHDVGAIRDMFAPGYVGIAGSGGELIAGGKSMAAYFANAFKKPAFLGFVRTPDVVTLAVPADRAMERGHWTGRSRTPTGETRPGGEYMAVWVPTPAGWRLRSESFVTLFRTEVAAPE